MKLREEILREHSKKQTMKIVRWVGNDADRFNELMNLFLNDENRVVQRSAWMVGYCGIQNPGFLNPFYKDLINYLEKQGSHPAVKRNILRIFQFTKIPKRHQGKLVDLCIKFLLSKEEPAAIKAFGMTVATNIAVENPELKNELRLVIDEIVPYSSAGVTSRAKCALKKLK